MLHNYKLGCISASQTIVITGIFLLIWAFGSYLIYVLTVPDPFVCFPPFSGCVSISHAGGYPFSGFFYRLLVLPLAPLLGLSMYFIVQFLQNINPDVRPNIRRTLILLGSVILPISLIVAEAFKDGHRFRPSNKNIPNDNGNKNIPFHNIIYILNVSEILKYNYKYR
jgi:hypothetical protein